VIVTFKNEYLFKKYVKHLEVLKNKAISCIIIVSGAKAYF